jgi:hypothetical protein
VFDIAALGVLLVVFLLLGVAARFDSIYPVAEVAHKLADAEAAGRPIAHIGEYRGEFHFAGRLRAPLAAIDAARAESWAAANPNGVIVTYGDRWQPRLAAGTMPLLETSFRDAPLRVFAVSQLILTPAAGQ